MVVVVSAQGSVEFVGRGVGNGAGPFPVLATDCLGAVEMVGWSVFCLRRIRLRQLRDWGFF